MQHKGRARMQTYILFVRERFQGESNVPDVEYGLLRYSNNLFAPIILQESDLYQRLSACLQKGATYAIKDHFHEDALAVFLPESIAYRCEGRFWWQTRCGLYLFYHNTASRILFPETTLIMTDVFDVFRKKKGVL
jgi:hypothetical protein